MSLIALILAGGIFCWVLQVYFGMGMAGKRNPQMWAMYITTFVFWIGIGHAGTLISAILYLFRAKWRTSIYRGSEAMTIFAVMTAGLFPVIHAGPHVVRVLAAPVPERAVPVAELPLAARLGRVRDLDLPHHQHGVLHRGARAGHRRPPGRRHRLEADDLRGDVDGLAGDATGSGATTAGPTASSRRWRPRWCVSVHSVVSWDFAMALVPGWHSTLFAPFFVDGAIFSGFAMVLVLLIPMRHYFNLYAYITDRHLDNMAKLILVTGLVLTYFYACEGFTAWYSGEPMERASYLFKWVGRLRARGGGSRSSATAWRPLVRSSRSGRAPTCPPSTWCRSSC